MNSNRVFDVIVVGAGPAGSACATTLSREGMDVLLLDRSRFPREKICGCCLNPGGWEILDNLGVAEAIRAAPHREITRVRLTSWKGRTASGSLPPRDLQSLIAIRRGIFDEILLSNAQRKGATVCLETQVCTVDPGSETIRITARDTAGAVTFSCRYAVGADGRNSIVAASVGSGAISFRQRKRRVGVQWFAAVQPNLPDEILLGLLPYGYFGITNVDERTANIAMVVDPLHAPGDPRSIPSDLAGIVRSSVTLRNAISDVTPRSQILTTSPITPRRNRARHHRIFLAGDAELTVEPFTGEGISFALKSGVEAAWRILTAEHRIDSPKLRRQNDFWVNRVYSPLLRHPAWANAALSAATGSPRLFSIALRTVIG